MIRTLAPSGNPIHLRDLRDCISQSGQNPGDQLTKLISSDLGVEDAFLFANGRGAMSFLLQCLFKERPDRKTVIVPSYTCYSVAASVLKADLDVLVCDIDEQTLSYDLEQLQSINFSNVLAIVTANLYGIPNNLPVLEALAKSNDVFLVDDAAQSLGATIASRKAGTFGDAGILSFDKGKVITSINGGAVITNNTALGNRIRSEYEQLDRQSVTTRFAELVKLQIYYLFLHPALYWLPHSLPFLALGKTRYDEEYVIERYFDFLAPVAIAQYRRMAEVNRYRKSCADKYATGIPESDLFGRVSPFVECGPVYLRYPLRIRNSEARRSFLRDYRKFGCSVSYPTAINDVPEIKDRISVHNKISDSGRTIASQLVTLPTHSYVRESDIKRICDGLYSLSTDFST